MYRYPGQTVEEVSSEIDILVDYLKFIDHITLYPLIIFPKLALYKQIILGKLPKQCSLKNYEQMNLLYSKRLKENGFNQYTSNHFSQPGKENKYNIDRWGFPQRECVAFGPGAFGQIKDFVYCNEHKISDYYIKIDSGIKPIQQGKKINLAEMVSRYLVLGTKCRNVDLVLFREITGFDHNTLYNNEINTLINEGLIEINNNELFVTDKGCAYIVDVNRAFQTENNLKFTQPQYYILDMMDTQSGHAINEIIEDC
jgi:coproporphyrinogen III oxidase-like Fe-S oxidoreductase